MTSEAIKIYLYLKHFPPYGDELNEGLCKAVHGLASGLVECGADVTVLSEGSGYKNSSFQTPNGYSIKCFANPIQSRPSFRISSGLKQYIRDSLNHNSLVVLNGILHPSIYSMSRLLKRSAVPYVVAPHDPYHPTIFSRKTYLKWLYWYLLEQRMLKQAKAVQVLDIRHSRWLHQLGIQTQVIATPNGFSSTDVYPELTLQYKDDGITKLFFLGRLDSFNKGLDLLIDAFAQIGEEKNVELVMQGPDWGDRKSLEDRTAKLSLSGKVSFLEPDYHKSPSSLIKEYDIFCIPSRFEGFSLAALEAMLAGRVLLVSEVAGIAPHVQASGCGVVVEPEVPAIKAGLIELLQRRSEWREMGLSGRRYALEHLQWNKIASTASEQYVQLVA